MKFSVIVPCYNVESRVGKCLDSLLNQSMGSENLEIILVDDSSTDGTVAVLQEYEKKYPDNIALILCEENGRQGRARNIGLSYATGEYVNFVDSDDEVHKDMYKAFTEILEKEPDAEIISFDFFNDEKKLGVEISLDYKKYDLGSDEERRNILFREDIINNSFTRKLYKKELLDSTGVRFPEGVSYEEPLFTYPLRFFAKHLIATSLPLYFYHLNAEGTINARMKDPSTITDHLSVQLQLLDFMRAQPFYETFSSEIELQFLHCFVYETFCFMQGRDITMPAELMKSISGIVREKIPKWAENPYLNSVPKEEKEIICLLQYS